MVKTGIISLVRFHILIGGLLFASLSLADIRIPELEEITQEKKKNEQCRHIVNESVKLQQDNQRYACHLKGSLWAESEKDMLQRCLSAPFWERSKTSLLRSEAIDRCLNQKASLSNAENIPNIPEACDLTDDDFQPFKQVRRYYYYQKTLEQPIQNGLIEFDYNDDGTVDYAFLESNKESARMIFCFSKEEGYEREISDLHFSAEGDSIEGNQFHISQEKDLLKIDVSSLSHNIGTSWRKVTYRYRLEDNKFEIVDNESGTEPVLYDGVPSPMYPAPFPTLTSVSIDNEEKQSDEAK